MPSSDQLRAAALTALLAVHAVGAAFLFWHSPHGFAPLSLRFFASQALPTLMTVVAAVTIWRRSSTSAAVLGLGGLWLGGALSALWHFPFSTWRFAIVAFPFGLTLGLLAVRSAHSPKVRAMAISVGVLCGIGWTTAQRAAEPSTRPLGGRLGEKAAGQVVAVSCGGLSLRVKPVLTFESCAGDRFWAFWANRPCPAPDDFATQVHLKGSVTVVEAQTRFEAPVFSHLNSFATVEIEGGGLRAAIAGGPDEAFPAADEPWRFAWLDDDGLLHTARATAQEKGPLPRARFRQAREASAHCGAQRSRWPRLPAALRHVEAAGEPRAIADGRLAGRAERSRAARGPRPLGLCRRPLAGGDLDRRWLEYRRPRAGHLPQRHQARTLAIARNLQPLWAGAAQNP